MQLESRIRAAFFGHAIGDALGVPVEFLSRVELDESPVQDFRAFGTHNQPAGTWSDDTSLMLCTAEAFCSVETSELLPELAKNFIAWYRRAYWSARGDVFDIGNATRDAILRLEKGEQPELAGGMEESANGNGSLMRILPAAFALQALAFEELIEVLAPLQFVIINFFLFHGWNRGVIVGNAHTHR